MAFTYAGQYTEAILATGSSGATLLPSLPAHLYTVGTSTHVTLYTSRTKGTTTANPVTSDVNGNVTFFADPGQYDIVFTPAGGSLKRITVTIPVDPAELAGAYAPITGSSAYVAKSARLDNLDASARDIALRTFHADLATVDTTPLNVHWIGTSITEGAAKTATSQRFQNRVIAALRARYQPSGIAGGAGYIPAYYVTGDMGQPYGVVTGSPAQGNSDFGYGMREFNWAVTTVRVPYTVSGTSVDLMYPTSPGIGDLGYSVDGGAVTWLSEVAGSTIDAVKSRVTFGSRGSHTITLQGSAHGIPANNGLMFYNGMMVYDQDESAGGIRSIDAGHSGYASYDLINSQVTAGYFASGLAALSPSLIVLEHGANDWAAGRTSAQFLADMTTILTAINASRTPAPSVVLMATAQRSDVASPVEPWANYVNVLYTLAATYSNVTVFDLTTRMPTVAADTYGLFTPPVHPVAKGDGVIANALTQFLTPS